MKIACAVIGGLVAFGSVTADAQLQKRFEKRFQGAGGPRIAGQKAREKARSWPIAPQLPPSLKLALSVAGRIRYAGTRTIEAKNGLNRVRHVEYVITDGPRSRIEFPNDSPMHGQVIIELPNERRHFLPGRNELQILPPQRDQAFERLAKMLSNRNVTVTETGGGPVAGIATELVSAADRLGDVIQKLWIDPRSGMILKREIYDRGGTMQASFEFSQVNLNPIINPTDFAYAPKGARIVTPDTMLGDLITQGGYQNVRLPAGLGFLLEGAHVQKVGPERVLVQQYAGRGHRVALYQLKSIVDSNRLGSLARPNLHIYSWQAGGSSFVLMGDLSDTELKDLGRRLGG